MAINLSVLAAAGIVGLFVILLALVILNSRKSQQQKTARAASLGFEPLEEVPDQLQRKFENLHRRNQHQELEIRNLHRRKGFDRELYLLDLIDTHDEDTWLGTEMFSVISPELSLPQFTLIMFPEINREGFLTRIMDAALDKFFDWAGKHQQLSRVHFPHQPELEDRLIIFARDEYTVRQLFSGQIGRYLFNLDTPLQLAGSGDFLTVESGFSVQTGSHTSQPDLGKIYRTTLEIVQILESR